MESKKGFPKEFLEKFIEPEKEYLKELLKKSKEGFLGEIDSKIL